MTRRELLAVTGTLLTPSIAAGQPTAGWKAGTATVDITPRTSLWMAGFALRKQPAQGTALALKAKALALQVGKEPPAVLVTTDLLGLTARMTGAVAAEVRRRNESRGRTSCSMRATRTAVPLSTNSSRSHTT